VGTGHLFRGAAAGCRVTADGTEARYSRPFATEPEARLAATLYADEVELAAVYRAGCRGTTPNGAPGRPV
jgi:hypothetical protein